MMRHTRAPQEGCGSSRVTCGRRKAARWVRLAMLAVLLASLGASHPAHAQDPSTLAPDVAKSTSFPKQSMVGPSRNIDKSQPLYLQGDELIYDTGGNRVIARGNVEIFYNNYILTADQVVYDQSANTLTAVGNVTAQGAERQHRPRRPDTRLPTTSATASSRSCRSSPPTTRASPPRRRRAAAATRPCSPMAGSRLAKRPMACRRCGA